VVSIPDIREYPRINAELVQRLDEGHPRVILAGAEGQRLLTAGLAGSWDAVVEIEGNAGPELAAGLDAPGLRIVCHGSAGDGAARGLRAGRVLVRGRAGDAVAYTQAGGCVVVAGPSGPRAGLDLSGGTLILLGAVGRLAGERQSGGRLFAYADRLGPHAGHGRRGGRLLALEPGTGTSDADDLEAYRDALEAFSPWLAAWAP
jgi:glutamate synthase domain-containing protein 3